MCNIDSTCVRGNILLKANITMFPTKRLSVSVMQSFHSHIQLPLTSTLRTLESTDSSDVVATVVAKQESYIWN